MKNNKGLFFTNNILVWLVMAGFILVLAAAMISSCGHIRLPDRSKCVIPWDERKTCVSDSDCAPDQLCAFRGRPMGKCTLVDCCDPWRNRRLERGKSWCTNEEDPVSNLKQ